MEIISLNVGRPVTVDYKGKPLETGIYKHAVEGPCRLGSEGFEGDEQADLVHHGGPDKAVCVYPYEHYPFWERVLGKKLEFSAFGENMTTSGLLETEVHIGDVFEIGTTLLQVSQPRYPCYKLSQKHGPADLPARVLETGFSGFYLRVLREGAVAAGDRIIRREEGAGRMTVSHVLQVMKTGRTDKSGLAELIALDTLSASTRADFRKWLETP